MLTLSDAYLSLGRQITDMANQGQIDGDRGMYYRRCGLARALLKASSDLRTFDLAVRLGKVLAAPLPGGKDWRPVAELAWKLGRQVAREQAEAAAQGEQGRAA